jgi:hypothetical protein
MKAGERAPGYGHENLKDLVWMPGQGVGARQGVHKRIEERLPDCYRAHPDFLGRCSPGQEFLFFRSWTGAVGATGETCVRDQVRGTQRVGAHGAWLEE